MDQKAEAILTKNGRFMLVSLNIDGTIDFATNQTMEQQCLVSCFLQRLIGDNFGKETVKPNLTVIKNEE